MTINAAYHHEQDNRLMIRIYQAETFELACLIAEIYQIGWILCSVVEIGD